MAPEKGLDNPQVQGIATIFEGKYLTQIYRFNTMGAKEYLKVLAADLSIQPHLEINYL